MKPETVRALSAINRRFYRRAAQEFDASRVQPWPGWHRLLEAVPQPPSRPLAVLDVGCGGGRFASFLQAERGEGLLYLGVDGSLDLLALARRRLQKLRGGSIVLSELLGGRALPLSGARFDLIALFGVLHHLPAFDNRVELVRALGDLLAPGGRLAITVWRFLASERLRQRLVPWSECRTAEGEILDPSTLEEGDHLLAWGGNGGLVRYCHFADDDEVARLLASLSLALETSYDADGESNRMNRYLILRRETDHDDRASD